MFDTETHSQPASDVHYDDCYLDSAKHLCMSDRAAADLARICSQQCDGLKGLTMQNAHLFSKPLVETGGVMLYQVDVIEAQSSKLVECIANAQDFSEAERAHQNFLNAIVTQSFLDMKAISTMLENIFSLCQRLCGYVQVQPSAEPLHCST